MLTDLFHRMLFPTLVMGVIGTIWVVGWCHAVIGEADRACWPAIPAPGYASEKAASSHDHAAYRLSQQGDDRLLQQVFLKHD